MAIKEFNKYLVKQKSKSSKMKQSSQIEYNLNKRQVALLQYLYDHVDERITLKSHITINQITNNDSLTI